MRSGLTGPLIKPVIAFDQRLKRSRSDSGMPIMRAITVTGSGIASASTMSISPPGSIRATRSAASAVISGRICAIRAGVNALLSSPRKLE